MLIGLNSFIQMVTERTLWTIFDAKSVRERERVCVCLIFEHTAKFAYSKCEIVCKLRVFVYISHGAIYYSSAAIL